MSAAASRGTPLAVVAAFVSSAAAAVGTVAPSCLACHWLLIVLCRLVVVFALNGFGDIDAPAGELCSQPSILPIFTDGVRQLLLQHCDDCRMVALSQFYFEGFDRAERVCDEGSRIRIPLNDIDFL